MNDYNLLKENTNYFGESVGIEHDDIDTPAMRKLKREIMEASAEE